MAEAAPYLVIGIQIAGGMAMFVIGGYFADQWLGTTPWLVVIGSLLGMVAVAGILMKTLRQLEEKTRSRKTKSES